MPSLSGAVCWSIAAAVKLFDGPPNDPLAPFAAAVVPLAFAEGSCGGAEARRRRVAILRMNTEGTSFSESPSWYFTANEPFGLTAAMMPPKYWPRPW